MGGVRRRSPLARGEGRRCVEYSVCGVPKWGVRERSVREVGGRSANVGGGRRLVGGVRGKSGHTGDGREVSETSR